MSRAGWHADKQACIKTQVWGFVTRREVLEESELRGRNGQGQDIGTFLENSQRIEKHQLSWLRNVGSRHVREPSRCSLPGTRDEF